MHPTTQKITTVSEETLDIVPSLSDENLKVEVDAIAPQEEAGKSQSGVHFGVQVDASNKRVKSVL